MDCILNDVYAAVKENKSATLMISSGICLSILTTQLPTIYSELAEPQYNTLLNLFYVVSATLIGGGVLNSSIDKRQSYIENE